ncbi:hypothetical protein GCM10011368_10990 [Hyunsoonleella pacifica]|nr:hypothetical protein GCM10011368_10990 [Hyunsoonleella pacifica]
MISPEAEKTVRTKITIKNVKYRELRNFIVVISPSVIFASISRVAIILMIRIRDKLKMIPILVDRSES